jgi:predicted RND superfamily exporter protein
LNVREKFEAGFEAWAGTVARHRFAIVALALAAVALAAVHLPKVELDTSTESYLLDGDPVRVAYDEMREQFGRDQIVLIALEPTNIFDAEFLEYLRTLHEALEEETPHLERLTSLINVRSVVGRGEELIVGDLLEETPTGAAGLEALRQKVMSTPSYVGGVISHDATIASIIVETDAYSSLGEFDALDGFDDDASGEEEAERVFITPAENSALVEAVKAIVDAHRRPDVKIYISGSAMLTHEVSTAMQREVPIFLGASLLVIAVALFVLFRRIGPCVVALSVVVLSMLGTVGTVGALGNPMSILSQILPSFLLAVGVGYSVHLFAIYFQRLDGGDSDLASLAEALRHSGPPIMMTALTTIAGLASFLAAEMPPIREFGKAGMIGVAWTLALNLTLLPALICILPMKARPRSAGGAATNRLMMWIGMTSAHNPWKAVGFASVLAIASLASATQLTASNNPIKYLAPDNTFRQDFEYLDEKLGASMSLELHIDAKVENGLYEPDTLNRLDELGAYVAEFEHNGHVLGKTTSVVDIAKETHQALNRNDPSYYAIPQQRKLIAQELLLFENSGADDVERLVDSQFRKARYSISTRFEDGNVMAGVAQKIQTDVEPIMGPGVEVVVTGASTLIGRAVAATSISLMRTYAVAFAVITPLMMLLIGSLRAGLVSMAPNVLPIALTLGLMPLISIPLDLFTMMVGCISIGLAVDDTVHLIHGFRARLAEVGDPYLAIEQALSTTGRALLFTSVVLSIGFLVLTMSAMTNLASLGLLVAFSVTAAFVLDIIVTPALLILVTPKPESAQANA